MPKTNIFTPITLLGLLQKVNGKGWKPSQRFNFRAPRVKKINNVVLRKNIERPNSTAVSIRVKARIDPNIKLSQRMRGSVKKNDNRIKGFYNAGGTINTGNLQASEQVIKDETDRQNIKLERKKAALNLAKHNVRDPILIKQAKNEAEQQYREKHNANVDTNRFDYDTHDPFMKKDGEYVRDQYGRLKENPNFQESFGASMLHKTHNLLQDAGVVTSFIPHPLAQGISKAIMYGQGAAAIENDLRNRQYGQAGLDAALTSMPLWGNKVSKTITNAFENTPIGKRIKRAYDFQHVDLRNMYTQRREAAEKVQSKIRQDMSEAMSKASDTVHNKTIQLVLRHHADQDKDYFINQALRKSSRDAIMPFVSEYAKLSANARPLENITKTININGKPTTITFPFQINNSGKVLINVPKKSGLEEYRKMIDDVIGDDAIVAGSTRLFTSGYTSGVPHDLELLTTKSRMAALKKKIGADGAYYKADNGFKQSLNGKDFVFNSDGGHMIDVQYIGRGPNGGATGNVAHNYYSHMYPKEYRELLSKWDKQYGPKGYDTINMELPITDEQLFQALQKHPNLMDAATAMDTLNGSSDKAAARAMTMMGQPIVRRIMDRDQMLHFGQHFSPSGYKFNMPNLAYKNNADRAAEDIADRFGSYFQNGTRTVYNTGRQPYNYAPNIEKENSALSTVVSKNGNASGIGGNQVHGYSAGGVGGDVTAVLQNPVYTLRDAINLIKLSAAQPIGKPIWIRQLGVKSGYKIRSINGESIPADTLYKKLLLASESSQGREITSDQFQRALNYTKSIANKYNVPGIMSNGYTDSYYGALQQPKVGIKVISTDPLLQTGKYNILESGARPVNLDFTSGSGHYFGNDDLVKSITESQRIGTQIGDMLNEYMFPTTGSKGYRPLRFNDLVRDMGGKRTISNIPTYNAGMFVPDIVGKLNKFKKYDSTYNKYKTLYNSLNQKLLDSNQTNSLITRLMAKQDYRKNMFNAITTATSAVAGTLLPFGMLISSSDNHDLHDIDGDIVNGDLRFDPLYFNRNLDSNLYKNYEQGYNLLYK